MAIINDDDDHKSSTGFKDEQGRQEKGRNHHHKSMWTISKSINTTHSKFLDSIDTMNPSMPPGCYI